MPQYRRSLGRAGRISIDVPLFILRLSFYHQAAHLATEAHRQPLTIRQRREGLCFAEYAKHIKTSGDGPGGLWSVEITMHLLGSTDFLLVADATFQEPLLRLHGKEPSVNTA
jgi:hypothetical protein